MKIERNILLNPGPATTTDTVKMAQVVPDICPREKEFGSMMKQIRQDLVRIVHGDLDKYTAVLFCGSGTINIDICLNSLLPKDKKALIINNGAYSTRATQVCDYYGLPYINFVQPLTEPPKLDEIEAALIENEDIALVYVTHNETGTGLLNPIREIGSLAHKYGAISVVDTTSTYAMRPIDIEKDNIDFCMASAQKGIQAMTGLSFIIGKEDIIKQSKDYPKRSYYCNLYMQYEFFQKTGEMHFTPPVQAIYAAKQALQEYFELGETAKWDRHVRVINAIHQGLEELGFRELLKREDTSGLVAAAIYPNDPNWNFDKIHDFCYEQGFTIYPGKVSETNTFRLCSLGEIDVSDIDEFFIVFKKALQESGVSIPVRYIE